MKGKPIESDTIRGPLATFLNELLNVDITIPEAEKAQEHKMVTVTWASPPPAFGRRYSPRNLPGVDCRLR